MKFADLNFLIYIRVRKSIYAQRHLCGFPRFHGSGIPAEAALYVMKVSTMSEMN